MLHPLFSFLVHRMKYAAHIFGLKNAIQFSTANLAELSTCSVKRFKIIKHVCCALKLTSTAQLLILIFF